jgi:hypothetical protein
VGGRPCSYPGRRGALAVGAMAPILESPPYCREEEEWGSRREEGGVGQEQPQPAVLEAPPPLHPLRCAPLLRRVAPRRVAAAPPRGGAVPPRSCTYGLSPLRP